MGRLFIFNPDSDYALACDRRYYTPPATVVKLRQEKALLPVFFSPGADNSLLILDSLPDGWHSLKFADECIRRKVKVFTTEQIEAEPTLASGLVATPWGWNKQIWQFLTDRFGKLIQLPSPLEIENIRVLSHRRTTIGFLTRFEGILNPEIGIPEEIKDVNVAIEAFEKHHALYFKAPWSSSGRGVMLTDDLERRHVEPWLHGIIKRQGSVMMEKAYNRRLDFATEWMCDNGKCRFLGFSVFNTSRRGKYHSNINASQKSLELLISESSHDWSYKIVERQQEVIECMISPVYSGPVGIDMLVTASGAVNPCVEINLRHTMGMVGLLHY